MDTRIVSFNLPVALFNSKTGKTFYAQIGLNGEYYTGESKESQEDAINNLKAQVKENIKVYDRTEKIEYNFNTQYYKGIPLKLINRSYNGYKAKRFTINGTNQNTWIPDCFLEKDGTIKKHADLSFKFRDGSNELHILELAGVKKAGDLFVIEAK